MRRCFVLTFLLCFPIAACKPQQWVILGSSIAEGELGLSVPDSSWAGRLTHQYKGKVKLINLAERGYNTYQILPNGASVRGKSPVDTTRNIDAGLKYRPNILLISMTSNDANMGYSVEEYLQNIATIRQIALQNGVKRVLISTTTPRNLPEDKRGLLRQTQEALLKTYPNDVIDFYSPYATADGLLKPEFNSGDHVHPNDYGHRLMFEQVQKIIKKN